ncbi:hypothetical protein H7K43_14655 [Streptomyces sp. TYQ1024]|nr:hypothetical protein [Streptomyces sp. TYQ1024]
MLGTLVGVLVGGIGLAVALVAKDDRDRPAPDGTPTAGASAGPSRDVFPTSLPSRLPTSLPTRLPSGFPSRLPSGFPTELPTGFPTRLPRLPTALPTALPPGLPGGVSAVGAR